MKTLSSSALKATNRADVAPILLAKIQFPDLAVYLSSRPFETRSAFNSITYNPIIIDWNGFNIGPVNPESFKTGAGEISLSIMNNIPIGNALSFSKLLQLHDSAFATVLFTLIHEGAASSGDEIEIFFGTIEGPETITREMVDLKISDYCLALRKKWPATIVNSTLFSGADPDDLGKMVGQAWGTVKRVPCRAVDAGGKSSIAEDMTDVAPGNSGTLEVTDGSVFPGPATAFTLQIDEEQVRIASVSGNTLTLAAASARGYGGTSASEHDKGSDCAEVKTHYYFMAADHAVKSIDAVYVDDIRQEITNGSNSDCRVYYGDSGDYVSGYLGRALIDFQTLALLTKQVNIGLTHTDTVTDAITVTDNIAFTIGGSQKTIYPTNATGANWTNHSNSYDGNEVSSAYTSTNGAILSMTFPATSYGTVADQIVNARLSYGNWNIGGGWTPSTLNNTSGSEWFRFTRSGGTWGTSITFTKNDAGGINRYVFEVEKLVNYAPTASKTGAASRGGSATGAGTASISGNSSADTVIGTKIEADMKGFFDRQDGYLTGVPGIQLIRANHIFNHLIQKLLNDSQGLVGYWPCHEANGTTLYDESGKNQDLSGVGTPTWSQGNIGIPCVEMLGAAEYFTRAAYDSPGEFITLSGWINSDYLAGAQERFFSLNAGGVGGWYIALSTTYARFRIWDDVSAAHSAEYACTPANAWHHLAASYDGVTMRLYYDGVEVATQDSLTGQALDTSHGFYIGYSTASSTYVEELRLYDRALAAYEIAELYNNPRGYVQKRIDWEEGLKCYWGLNDGAGVIAYDGQGSVDLILTGTAGTPTWLNDPVRGMCLDFDSSDNQTAVNPWMTGRSANPVTQFSVSIWFNADTVAANSDIFFRDGCIGIRITPTLGIQGFIYTDAWYSCSKSAAYTLNSWVHVAFTYDGVNMKLYVDNGSPTTTAPGTAGAILQQSGNICLACWDNSSNYFDGSIDEVRFFDYPLTAAEVENLYQEDFDEYSYTEAGALIASGGHDINLAVMEKPFTNDLLNDLARQVKTIQFFEAGVHKLKFIEDNPAADKEILAQNIELGSLEVTETLRSEIINDFVGLFDRWWSFDGVDGYRQEVVSSSSASINKYGKITEIIKLDAVAGSAEAQIILDWLNGLFINPRKLISLTGFQSEVDLERGDVVSLAVDSGIILHWPLYEGAGVLLEDLGAYEVTTSFNDGPTWANCPKGPGGKCLYFDGTNDYIEVAAAYSDYFDFTTEDYTVAFWIKAAAGSTNHRVICKGAAGASGWEIIYDASSRIMARTYTAGVSDASYSSALTADTWHHITVIRTGQEVKIFVNGEIDLSIIDIHATPIVSNAGLLTIGEYQTSKGTYMFAGSLADIRIYNRALSRLEIQNLVAGKSAGFNLYEALNETVKQRDKWRVIGKEFDVGLKERIALVEDV